MQQASTPQGVTQAGTPQRAVAQGVRSQADVAVQLLGNKASNLKAELAELAATRAELTAQRHLLNNEAARTTDTRISVIDARAAKLEAELYATNDQLREANAGELPKYVQTTTEPSGRLDADARAALEDAVFEAVGIATTSIVAIYVTWRLLVRGYRRFISKEPPVGVLRDNSAQLHQLQQSMDVIALEVERISEAQRYTAKLLSDKGEKVPSIRS